MRLYLAGPMSGIPEANYPAFHSAAADLRKAGHYVLNPAEIAAEGWHTDLLVPLRHEEYRRYLIVDLQWINSHAEGIALLPGWKRSKGARTEEALATALGLVKMPLYIEGDGEGSTWWEWTEIRPGVAGYNLLEY